MQKFRGVRRVWVTILFLVCFCGTCYGDIPKNYWQYQVPFANAVESGNDQEVVRIGKEIIADFAKKI